jgi:hypothetical protein
LALIAADGDTPLSDIATLEACGSPTRLVALKQATKVDEYKMLGVDETQMEHLTFPVSAATLVEEDGSDVILCESSARAKVVAEAAKAAELPFVRFEVLLVEGELNISGDTCRPCRHKFRMDPAFISIGDCGHVLGLGSVSSEWKGGGTWWEAEETLRDRNGSENPRLYNLKSVLKQNLNTMDVMKYVFGDCDSEVEDKDMSTLVEVPKDVRMSKMQKQSHPHNPSNSNMFFHINVDGQTCFTAEQAVFTSTYLKQILFIDQLKKQIKEVEWQFPQSSKSRQETLCNERVYGHVNILMVSGVVRLSEVSRGSEIDIEARAARRSLLLQVYRGDEGGDDEDAHSNGSW